ncbi:2-oxo acid dehydrogenase subunit E2 [Ornithinimicrobium faecis]|uniref:Dihydrolipoamide acetyltransferase component of pyruvate dehydrogenase complex n=1 Tax=Ornithinimicrobium faecis TaxID=2934158 RepID=A0ABY4YTB5_9MICO|nr:dihydrolipoamide acetyltransferase family protein [Ornithinimicrobium sp. HY1793]USQ79819.1 2-oxo acid dehydrogenase subunit E2 [Ornithinimicrobium sp. HY1793]
MTQVFLLPDLGEGLTEATVVEWHVAEGDMVTIDQDVVTVETAKAAVEVPCPYAGVVTTLHSAPGEELAVGTPLITIAALADAETYRTEERAGAVAPSGGSAGSPERPLVGYGASEPARRSRRGRAAARAEAASVGPEPASQTAIRVISPLVRKLAADAQVDLASVTPTGEGGVIRRADVEAAIQQTSAPAATTRVTSAGDTRIPLTGMRKAIAHKLTTSRREIPDATTWVDVDATELMATKDALKVVRPQDAIGILPLLARITVAGLRQFPELNSSVDGDEIVQHGRINLGFAAQSPRGLVVPVVHDAHTMTTAELAAALRDLTEAAREGTLTPAQLTGGTFTLNNYGVFGVDGSTPIINHPEAAMLGVGRIIDKPWAHGGQVALRKVTQLSFTFDHRVCDGGTAGGFLRYVADCVEEPAVLLASL